MISIEGLLEDEQGLSMGELLTVKIRQPSHEFTFGVGMTFASYPLVGVAKSHPHPHPSKKFTPAPIKLKGGFSHPHPHPRVTRQVLGTRWV
jgi:hypothetical protein